MSSESRLTPPLESRATPARRSGLAWVLMAASGFAGLGYQIVWTQQGALWLGHETAAVLAVVAAFFGGLALGSRVLGDRIARTARPARAYAACEFAIAAWSLILAGLMAPASAWLLDFTGAQPTPAWQWAVAFGGTFVLLLPATAAMGATLPALERVVAAWRAQGGAIAGLYASNTFGAVLGVLASAFSLVPQWGLTRTALLCASLNVACGVAAWALWGRVPAPVAQAPATSAGGRGPLLMLAATGLLGIGYEVLVVRVLSQVTEDTVYTFALLLAVYLIGSALGAAAYQRWAGRADDRWGKHLLTGLSWCCLLGTGSLWGAEWLRDSVQQRLGAGMGPALGAEAALALAAFGLPTVLMGALFSHLCARAAACGIAFGRGLAANTAGAALAPLVFGVWLVPMAGPKAPLLAVAAGYLALAAMSGGGRAWRQPGTALVAAGVAGLAFLAPPLAFVDVPEGGRVVSYREGATAAVSVVEDAAGVLRLRIDNRQQEGSSGTRFTDARQALLPVLLHPAPRRALFLGLGTGITAASAAEDPGLDVDAVELLPEVIASSPAFLQAFGNGSPNPRLHLLASDARRYVRTAATRYDVVVADNFHPARSGSGSLYTVEHFRAVRERLAPGGLFCQWLPLHQLDLDTLRSIVRAFLTVYPQGRALLATNSLETPVIGLVGQGEPAAFSLSLGQQRLQGSALKPTLPAHGLGDAYALLGSFVAGPTSLAAFAAPARLNTDDLPVVAYAAPRITYAPDSRPRDRLMALLAELRITPAELLDPAADPEGAARLADYWQARSRFLEAGLRVRPVADPRAMLAQVREPLLGVLQISADFRPAYDPLLQMARALGASDPAAARTLLNELVRLQPAWPQAAQALAQLPPAPP